MSTNGNIPLDQADDRPTQDYTISRVIAKDDSFEWADIAYIIMHHPILYDRCPSDLPINI
jgi:hypothetical protein